jgi:DNA-binding NarL/FixJ family response regulator
MLQCDGVLTTAQEKKPRLVVSRRVPVLIPEDTLSDWLNLKRCLAKEPDWMVIRCPSPLSEVLAECSRLKPCSLVIDHRRFEQLDPQCFVQTADFGRSVSVLVKVAQDNPETIKQMLRLGCMGFVTEHTTPTDLRSAIRAITSGELWVSARILAEFTRDLLSCPNPQNLTPRESQVLSLISRGLSNREISKELFISRETVRWHIRTLYAKIGAKSREEAVQHGLSNNSDPVRLHA